MALTTPETELTARSVSAIPPAPTTLEEAGLSLDLMTQLVLKTLHFAGELTGTELAQRLGLDVLRHRAGARLPEAQQQCEIAGGAMVGARRIATASPMPAAQRAALFLEHNHYVGVAPVPLEQYQRYMAALPGGGAARARRAIACARRSRTW